MNLKTFFLCSLLLATTTYAQNRYLTQSGIVSFEASVPSFEEVAATTNTATVILNPDSGEIAALIFVKGFKFKNALMEEHFNENYAESDEFPKALFQGKIDSYNTDVIKSGSKSLKISGELTFHGVTKTVEINDATLTVNGDQLKLSFNFALLANEFNIKIPKIVGNKVSNQVNISCNFELSKQ